MPDDTYANSEILDRHTDAVDSETLTTVTELLSMGSSYENYRSRGSSLPSVYKKPVQIHKQTTNTRTYTQTNTKIQLILSGMKL